jgi:hypothetical protein
MGMPEFGESGRMHKLITSDPRSVPWLNVVRGAQTACYEEQLDWRALFNLFSRLQPKNKLIQSQQSKFRIWYR